ncbi:putative spermidine/putrescine transport system permease protein [Rhodobacteraceae bacterium MBR-64]
MSDTTDAAGRIISADGRPLKASLNRALRREKLRALALIAPLLIFVLITFIAPIADMLFRSVENDIVSNTMPRTVASLRDWDSTSGEVPGAGVFESAYFDLAVAAQKKLHSQLGTRLNYELTGMSSMFRRTGRRMDDVGEVYMDQFAALDQAWESPEVWAAMIGDADWLAAEKAWAKAQNPGTPPPAFEVKEGAQAALPLTAALYKDFADYLRLNDGDSPTQEEPWPVFYAALYTDLINRPDAATAFSGADAQRLQTAAAAVTNFEAVDYKAAFVKADDGWGQVNTWATIKAFSPKYTPGYFLNAVDMQKTPQGISAQPESQQIYILLFKRTLFLSLTIMFSCIALGYPVAWLLANLPARSANLLLILVLLPFWTSLLVRTSAWKVLLQQQGVINDTLVWIGLVNDTDRLVLINNQFGTIVAMTHILLPFMILPLYSVMKTIPPSYLRAAKSLGATNWTAFWRVYFPQSVPGIGAGSILVFILSIGYYITPELVGGTTGTFISNRIAYHISSSLNWGLAAALGTILLVVVLALYWAYDRIVGIDNVKLGG